MKSLLVKVCTPLLPLLLFLPNAAAARETTTLALGSGALFLSDAHSSGTPFASIKAKYSLLGKDRSSTLGIEGLFLYAADPDVLMLRVDALYPLVAWRNWKSYFSIGLGGESIGSKQEPLVAGGVSLYYQPNTPAALRFDVRHLREIAVEERTGWEVGLLLSYEFGFQAKPRPRPPADADGDGIGDLADRCPETPKEFKVDRNGCPVDAPDTDGDRVPDFQDRCPGTDRKFKAGPDGCPPDGDQDGVPDVVDRCPDTPSTMPIAEDGCVKIRKD